MSALSSSLLDGTVFEIVKNLNELQHLSERNFFTERSKILNEYTSKYFNNFFITVFVYLLKNKNKNKKRIIQNHKQRSTKSIVKTS